MSSVTSVETAQAAHPGSGLTVGMNFWTGGVTLRRINRNHRPEYLGKLLQPGVGEQHYEYPVGPFERRQHRHPEDDISYGGKDTGQDEGNEDTFNHEEFWQVSAGTLTA